MYGRWITAVALTAAVGLSGCSSTDESTDDSSSAVELDDVTNSTSETDVYVVEEVDEVAIEDLGEVEWVPREPLRDLDERTEEVLRDWADALTKSKQFSFRVESATEEFISTGQAIDLHAEGNVVVRRPDGLFVDRMTDVRHRRLHFDGTTVALHDVPRGMYAKAEVPGTVDGLLDRLAERFGVSIPLSDLAASDPYDALSEYADEGHFVGTHRVRGVSCHHLVFSNGALDWQMWVQAEGDPVLRQLTIIYKDEPGVPRYSAFLSEWNLQDTTPASSFSFTPPSGAYEVELATVPVDEDEDQDDDTVDEGESR